MQRPRLHFRIRKRFGQRCSATCASSGYSYNALADEVRQGVARLYLQQPDVAIAEVAYLLGFSDQSTFNRAFKRWNGLTPKRYRTRAI